MNNDQFINIMCDLSEIVAQKSVLLTLLQKMYKVCLAFVNFLLAPIVSNSTENSDNFKLFPTAFAGLL